MELRFLVRAESAEQARRAVAPFLADEVPGDDGPATPWREVYPDFGPPVALRGARKREGLTQKQLAEALGLKQSHISGMEHGRRPIGKAMAKRLAGLLNVDYRVFL